MRPRDILTRESFENAIAGVVASGGSTNAVLHLLAIAREAGVALAIDDFNRISRPDAADRRPQAGRPVRRDRPLQAPAASPLVAKRLRRGRPVPRRRRDRHRQDDRRGSRRGRRKRRARRSSAPRPIRSRRPAAWSSCTATSRPRAASSRSPATRPRTTPARRACSTARKRRSRPCSRVRSSPATSSSSATKGRAAARACARCWPSPARSWAPGSANRWRC